MADVIEWHETGFFQEHPNALRWGAIALVWLLGIVSMIVDVPWNGPIFQNSPYLGFATAVVLTILCWYLLPGKKEE